MNCPKCGVQIPDGSTSCMYCGEVFSAQGPMGQSEPYSTVPAYAQTFTPIKRSNKKPIIIAAICAAVVAAIAVVLFVVILPNMGGVESKLKHKWNYSAEAMGMTVSMTYDFKNNKMDVSGMGLDMSVDIEWKVTGDDTLSITMTAAGQTQTTDMKFKLASDNKTLTLTPVDDESNAQVFTRTD